MLNSSDGRLLIRWRRISFACCWYFLIQVKKFTVAAHW